MKRLDKDGFAIVTVEDIISYLSTLPKDTRVYLDKDGWLENETPWPWECVEDLVRYRGLFYYNPQYGLTINN